MIRYLLVNVKAPNFYTLTIMKLAGISEPTLLKYKKEIREEMIEEGLLE